MFCRGLISAALMLGFLLPVTAQVDSSNWRLRLLDSLYNPKPADSALKFSPTVIDAGVIAEDGGKQVYEYEWRNTGSEAVRILNVTTTCGCAVPSYSKEAVAPGAAGSLTITYWPKGHPGPFDRRIFVYTEESGSRPAAVLRLKGVVEAADRPVWLYRYQMGNLYLRRVELEFSAGEKAVERIACMNGGSKALTLGVEMLPPFLSFRCEPETVPPGGEADIVITYDPEAVPMRLMNVVPVILKGVDVPPSQRTVRVLIKD